jgi:site-specific DNA recombinase
MSREEIKNVVTSFGGLLLLRQSQPGERAELHRQLGPRLENAHEKEMVPAEARPAPSVCAEIVSEGGLEPPRPIKGTSTSS